VGLFTREDMTAAAPALVLIGWWSSRSTAEGPGIPAAGRSSIRYVQGHAAALAGLLAAFFVYRARVLAAWAPEPGHDVVGMLQAAVRAATPGGVVAFDALGSGLRLAWWVALALGAVTLLCCRDRVDGRPPALWLAAGVLACSPGLTLRR